MPLELDLHLEDRQSDRVIVSVRLAPAGDLHPVDGIALQLVSPDGRGLSPRLLLPISGQLASPVTASAELRTHEQIPRGSRVVASAWWGTEEIEVTCPSDRGTCLEYHMRGRVRAGLDNSLCVERLAPSQRARLMAMMPWAAEPLVPFDPKEIEAPTEEITADQICAELGLDGEDAEWLKDLLAEDD